MICTELDFFFKRVTQIQGNPNNWTVYCKCCGHYSRLGWLTLNTLKVFNKIFLGLIESLCVFLFYLYTAQWKMKVHCRSLYIFSYIYWKQLWQESNIQNLHSTRNMNCVVSLVGNFDKSIHFKK